MRRKAKERHRRQRNPALATDRDESKEPHQIANRVRIHKTVIGGTTWKLLAVEDAKQGINLSLGGIVGTLSGRKHDAVFVMLNTLGNETRLLEQPISCIIRKLFEPEQQRLPSLRRAASFKKRRPVLDQRRRAASAFWWCGDLCQGANLRKNFD
jgi:hypothetical protein